MATTGKIPAPLRIEYPANTYKRDELTGGGDGPKTFTQAEDNLFNNILDNGTPRDPDIGLAHMPTTGFNMCYRNAALTLLMNTKPMIQFLNEIASSYGAETSIGLLKQISDAFWDDSLSQAQRSSNLPDLVNDWWREMSNPSTAAVNRWDSQLGSVIQSASRGRYTMRNQQSDAGEFIGHIMNRLAAELIGNDLSVFDRLFNIRYIQRQAYLCNCREKRRQPKSRNEMAGYFMTLNIIDPAQTFQGSLQAQFHDYINERLGDCPTCGARQTQFHAYRKFQYLPEVLQIQTTFADDYGRFRRGISIDLPDVIDLSFLQDYRQGDSNVARNGAATLDECKYRLQVLNTYIPNLAGGEHFTGAGGHYISYVRRPNGHWDRVDEISGRTPISQVPQVNLSPDTYPRILVYVRDRSSPGLTSPRDPQIQQPEPPSPSQRSRRSSYSGALPSRSPSPASPTTGHSPNSPQTPQSPASLGSLQSRAASGTSQSPVSSSSSQPTGPQYPVPSTLTTQAAINKVYADHGISKGPARGQQKLLQRYADFYNASNDQKLSYLLRTRLATMAQSKNLTVTSSSKVNDLITSILQVRGRTRTSRPQNTKTRLRARITHLQQQRDRLRRERDWHRQDRLRLRRDRDRLRKERNQARQSARNARRQLQRRSGESAPDTNTTNTTDATAVTPRPAPAIDTRAQIAVLWDVPRLPVLDPPKVVNAAPHVRKALHLPRISSPPPISHMLRVTVPQILSDVNSDDSDYSIDDVEYIRMLRYNFAKPLVTNQWIERRCTYINDVEDDAHKRWRLIVYVTVRDQMNDDGTGNHGHEITYRYEVAEDFLTQPETRDVDVALVRDFGSPATGSRVQTVQVTNLGRKRGGSDDNDGDSPPKRRRSSEGL